MLERFNAILSSPQMATQARGKYVLQLGISSVITTDVMTAQERPQIFVGSWHE